MSEFISIEAPSANNAVATKLIQIVLLLKDRMDITQLFLKMIKLHTNPGLQQFT